MVSKKDIWVSKYNFIDEVVRDIHLPLEVRIYDTTLRDGEQVPGLVFRKDEKLKIALALDELGVQRIEVGMPAVSAEDEAAATEIAKLGLDAEIWGFARCVRSDIDACIRSDLGSLVCEIATSDLKMKAYGLTKEAVLEKMVDAVSYAKAHGMRVAFFDVDMTRTDLDFLKRIYLAAVNDAHADEVVSVDTLGVATPESFYYLTKKVREWVHVPLHTHCHNEFGMGVANSIAAIKAGAEWVHVSVNGLGEKSGNTDLAEVAMALLLLYDKDVGLKFEKLTSVSKLVQQLSGIEMPVNKPIVGGGVFKRESGLAVQQLIAFPPAVEPYPPELVGAKREIVLGKKSGKHSIKWKLGELGISLNDEQTAGVLEKVKARSIQKKGSISDEEFKTIVDEVV